MIPEYEDMQFGDLLGLSELKQAAFSIDVGSVARPDGLSARFYQC